MVWFQIILLSTIAGIALFFINKTGNVKSRKYYFLLFIIVLSCVIMVAFGLQARIDTSNIIFGYILPGGVFSMILCAEAVFISIIINKYTKIDNIIFYLPTFFLGLGLVNYITLLALASFYPGS